MEPVQTPGEGAPEHIPHPGEVIKAPAAPEAAPKTNSDAGPASTAPAGPVAIPDTPTPQLPSAPVSNQSSPPSPSSPPNPAQAGDVDVIEKEWVDQANLIVNQTKEDPYQEEEAIESLQTDYLKKRYGHEVKKTNEE
jgi:hypothetical protein